MGGERQSGNSPLAIDKCTNMPPRMRKISPQRSPHLGGTPVDASFETSMPEEVREVFELHFQYEWITQRSSLKEGQRPDV